MQGTERLVSFILYDHSQSKKKLSKLTCGSESNLEVTQGNYSIANLVINLEVIISFRVLLSAPD